jgi:hypothetical protein
MGAAVECERQLEREMRAAMAGCWRDNQSKLEKGKCRKVARCCAASLERSKM